MSEGATNVSSHSIFTQIAVTSSDVCVVIGVVVVVMAIALYVRRNRAMDHTPQPCDSVTIAGAGSCVDNRPRVRRRLLILDMNGLLCHRKHVTELKGIPFNTVARAEKRGNQFIWKRPYVDEFLEYCVDRFDVAIWSSATKTRLMEFLPAVVRENIYNQLAFVWAQDKCDQDEHDHRVWKKNLQRVYNMFPQQHKDDVLLLDDVLDKVRDNERYSVMLVNPWSPYHHHQDDNDGGGGGESKGYADDDLCVGQGWLWHTIQELAYYEGSARDFIQTKVLADKHTDDGDDSEMVADKK